jgi:hypothetical protein
LQLVIFDQLLAVFDHPVIVVTSQHAGERAPQLLKKQVRGLSHVRGISRRPALLCDHDPQSADRISFAYNWFGLRIGGSGPRAQDRSGSSATLGNQQE